MSSMASQITGASIVYLTVSSGADQRKHQSSASLAFVRGIHRWPVNSPHKGSVTRKMFPFDDVIMDWPSSPLKNWTITNLNDQFGNTVGHSIPSDHSTDFIKMFDNLNQHTLSKETIWWYYAHWPIPEKNPNQTYENLCILHVSNPKCLGIYEQEAWRLIGPISSLWIQWKLL